MALRPGMPHALLLWKPTRCLVQPISRASPMLPCAVHTSSIEALDAALRQRRAGSDVCIETCLHYLTHDTTSQVGVIGKVNPPPRLRTGKRSGTEFRAGILIQSRPTISTDQLPVRMVASGRRNRAFRGLTPLPVLLTYGHHQRGLPLTSLIPLVTENPARRMEAPARVRCARGDADIAIIGLNSSWIVGKDRLGTDAGYSIYEGETMKSSVVRCRGAGSCFAMASCKTMPSAVGNMSPAALPDSQRIGSGTITSTARRVKPTSETRFVRSTVASPVASVPMPISPRYRTVKTARLIPRWRNRA